MYPIEKYQFKVFEKKNADGTKSSVVVALSTYAGKVVKGVAKCIATDPFDLETGKKLAAARCDYKVCLKRANRALVKRQAVAKKIEDLTQYFVKMNNYCDDAIDECNQSYVRLTNLEKELG